MDLLSQLTSTGEALLVRLTVAESAAPVPTPAAKPTVVLLLVALTLIAGTAFRLVKVTLLVAVEPVFSTETTSSN